jgi:EAL domain-containing protein (putative c-di-GMP-specific phosphodiesterase class I)
VLVVDDRDANLLLLDTILRAEGVTEIETLTDPLLAVDRCLAFQPDVLLLDLHMPQMDGYAVLHELRDRLAPDVFLPVVVLTADATNDARVRALEAGAKDFLTKPLDRLEVVLRLRNLLETCSLYAATQARARELQRELDQRTEEDRRIAAHRRRRIELIGEVLAGDGLQMVYQPIIEIATGHVLGVEALARFTHEPVRPPDEWFAEARQLGLAQQLELLSVRRALDAVDRLPEDVFISVNVSPDTATTEELVDLLAGVNCERVVLELTEHDEIADYEWLSPWLDRHRARGVRIAVDDAGAGYAGLQHILSLQPDVIKLDLALIRNVDTDPARRALCACLMRFADEIGAEVVAEGIETLGEFETVRALGIRWGQGFYLGRPVDFPQPTTQTVVVA